MLLDTRVIAAQGTGPSALAVLAQRHEVMFRVHGAVQLHPVHAAGLPMIMLRAVQADDATLLLVDLRHLVRALDAELRITPERDQVGHVFYALRGRFRSAADFLAACDGAAIGRWVMHAATWVWQPNAGCPSAQTLAQAREVLAQHAARAAQRDAEACTP